MEGRGGQVEDGGWVGIVEIRKSVVVSEDVGGGGGGGGCLMKRRPAASEVFDEKDRTFLLLEDRRSDWQVGGGGSAGQGETGGRLLCCTMFSFFAAIFLALFGFTLRSAPLYIKGVDEREGKASTNCFLAAAMYGVIWGIGVIWGTTGGGGRRR